jgi:hypothetical protein
MSETTPDPKNPRRRTVRQEHPSDPNVFDQRDLYSVIVGAAVVGVQGTENTDIVIDLSDKRQVIIPPARTGARLRYDAPESTGWDIPLPLVVENVKNNGLDLYVQSLEAVGRLFAVVLLTQTGRFEQIAALLAKDPTGRPLLALAGDDELIISSSGSGSWYLNLIPKTKEAFKVLFLIATSISVRGRDIMFRRLEAEAKLKEAVADRAVIEVERRRIALQKDRAAAIREQLKTASDLLQFHKIYLSARPVDDPVRLKFEKDFQLLTATQTGVGRLSGRTTGGQ